MTSSPKPCHLIEKLLAGELTSDEAELILRVMKESPETVQEIRDNLIADCLLKRFGRHQRETCEIPLSGGRATVDGEAGATTDHVLTSEKESEQLPETDSFDWVNVAEETAVSEAVLDLADHTVRLHKKFQLFRFWGQERRNTPHHQDLPTVAEQTKGKWNGNLFFTIRLAVFFAFFAWLVWTDQRSKSPEPVAQFEPMAHIIEMIEPVWDLPEISYQKGQGIEAGLFALKSGSVTIQYANGARLILEGPVRYVVGDSAKGVCNYGKVNAHIPPEAVGFEIASPFGSVIDRGTAFYLDVGVDSAEVGMVEGKAELCLRGVPSTELTKGEAASFGEHGNISRFNTAFDKFFSFERFSEKLRTIVRTKCQKEERQNEILDANESLLARFDFANSVNERVANSSRKGRDFCSDLTLASCRYVEGRLFETQAACFDRSQSRAEFSGRQTSRSMTLIANVRLGQLNNWRNVLFFSSVNDRDQGAFIWQISKRGELIFMQIPAKGGLYNTYQSPVCLKMSRQGTWCQLALVLDGTQKTITHYLNGKPVSTHQWNHPTELVLDNGSIGNVPGLVKSKQRAELGMAIGEFMIYDKALTANEISETIK